MWVLNLSEVNEQLLGWVAWNILAFSVLYPDSSLSCSAFFLCLWSLSRDVCILYPANAVELWLFWSCFHDGGQSAEVLLSYRRPHSSVHYGGCLYACFLLGSLQQGGNVGSVPPFLTERSTKAFLKACFAYNIANMFLKCLLQNPLCCCGWICL